MNHPQTPVSFKKKEGEGPDAAAAVDGLLQNPTATTEGDTPDSKSSTESIVVDDANYLAPCKFDVLLTDVTAAYLAHDLSSLFEVQYLSHLQKDEELVRYKKRKVYGSIVGNNKRFLLNLPCRRASARNDPSSPKKPLPFVNIFFLVETGSPFSFVCSEAMEALCGGNKGNPIPNCMNVELLTGNHLELHVSPSGSHFEDINLLGASALSIADIASQNRRNTFFLEFNEI